MSCRVSAAITLALLLMASTSARAHLADTGLGPVVDGVAHLLLSFDDLLPVLAMALLAGLNGPLAGRCALFVVPAAWLAGGLLGFHGAATQVPAGLPAASLLLLGALVAADRRLGLSAVVVLAAVLGLVHGWLNGVAITMADREAGGLVGIVVAVFVVAALCSAGVISLRAAWARTAVRVAGSWISATGLLLAGWALSGRL